jgi:RHH-type proline utilization regulon transcriptional repressor/proline dehydrogenase/delta 1-pyrroline-5-carboxylate dehydrogenase
MLKGAMEELSVGSSQYVSTDVGPVIDTDAQKGLLGYIEELQSNPERARLLYSCDIDQDSSLSCVAPQMWQLGTVLDVSREVFGPILHVVRYKGEYLDQVINDINSLGYGLTLGLHTRLESTMHFVQKRAHVGNMYVNRNMIGAVVGVQPFGGEGLSGTGFKAGGPNYLLRFVHERTYTQDTTAAGGNASLLASLGLF